MKNRIILLLSVIIISIFGLIMIYSASSIWSAFKFNDSFHYVKYQSIFLIIGFIFMIILSKVDYDLYYKYSNNILLISILLLILVLIPGIGSIRNGSRSWFGIGPFGIQPSEAAKISMIIFTSKYLSNENNKNIIPILIVLLVIFGLIMLQPDLGTGTIILCSVLAILFIKGVSFEFFLTGGLLGTIAFIILILVAPYRLNRITSFINPWQDELGTGFQIIQSLYAIGPGGLLGMGYLKSVQKHFYLPEPQTDFIFSIIVEEFGILGALIVTTLFALIVYSGIMISIKAKDLFSKYLSFGLVFQIIFQGVLNLMVVVGLIPVTGVTLPFLSYGGSSLLVSMSSIGIILNISKNNN